MNKEYQEATNEYLKVFYLPLFIHPSYIPLFSRFVLLPLSGNSFSIARWEKGRDEMMSRN
jgi:hypothetical protein